MENPPSFLNLLREVMEEEGRQAAKQSQTTSKCHQRVRTVKVEKEKESEAVTQSELQAQIQELRAQLEERNHSGVQPLSDCTFKPQTEKQKQKSDSQSEIRSLRKQVKALENKMSVMAVKSTSDPHKNTQLSLADTKQLLAPSLLLLKHHLLERVMNISAISVEKMVT